MSGRRRLIAVLASVGTLLLVTAAGAAPTITEYTAGLPSGSTPEGIAVGSNGSLWFTDEGPPAIGEINPTTHAITEFPLSAGSLPLGIAAGPDGNLWFTDQGTTKAIGEINPTTHAINEYSMGLNPSSSPIAIAAGPDGNMWFTDNGIINSVGKINPTTHAITEYPTGLNTGTAMRGIAAGPDGNMWFTAWNDVSLAAHIGEIDLATSTPTINAFSTGLNMNSNPYGIAKGPDGNMWFTDGGATRAVGEFNPTTHAINEFAAADSTPRGIAAGPDGNMWFTDQNSRIDEVNPTTHVVSEFPASILQQPEAIVAGPDGNMWFTDPYGPGVGDVVIGSSSSGATPSVGAATVSGTNAHVHIGCKGSGACPFKLTLSAAKTTKKVVVVGSGSRTLSGGQSATVTVSLNGAGRSLLAKRHRLKVKLVVTSGSTTVATKTLTFVKHKTKKR